MEKIFIDETAYVQEDSRSRLIPTNKDGFFVAVCDRDYKHLGKAVSLVTDTLPEDIALFFPMKEVQGKLWRVLGSSHTTDFFTFPNKSMITGIQHRHLLVKDASEYGIPTRRMGIASLLTGVLDGIEGPLEFEYSRRPSRIMFEMQRGFMPDAYIFEGGEEVYLDESHQNDLLENVQHRLESGLYDVNMFDHVVRLRRVNKEVVLRAAE